MHTRLELENDSLLSSLIVIIPVQDRIKSNQIKKLHFSVSTKVYAKVAQYGLVYTKQKWVDVWNN